VKVTVSGLPADGSCNEPALHLCDQRDDGWTGGLPDLDD
jgi:hypothetical protein